ncbi:MAG: ATP-dependent Clp protease proteolytic subunit [Lachnospiraceae bacterium]|nr:ATP-dependent Clp protease proteolytic subunit [Lachnospiraceae bacterium]
MEWSGKDTEHREEKPVEESQEEREQIREFGQLTLDEGEARSRIHLLTIIGEIEGHDNLSANTKTTKYEHILPQLAALEDSREVEGLLILLNTVGGDVEAGLAIAEMIASLSKPTVSLVLGGSHSIGVPLAVATDYSFIVETGTMLIHPVRMNGMILGVPQTYDYFKRIQDRITGFIASHSRVTQERLEELMLETGEMSKDMGSILVGKDAVREGLIDSLGGIHEALAKLRELMGE